MKKLLILCLFFILITGCTDKNNIKSNINDVNPSTSANTLSEEDINKLPPNLQDIAKASIFEYTKVKSSTDLIQDAFNTKKITKEESIGLELIAGYYSDQLPSEYKGESSGSGLQDAKCWLAYNWDNLDEETKLKFEEFHVSAFDLKSHFQKKGISNKLNESLTIIPSVKAEGYIANKEVKIDSKVVVKIQYYSANADEAYWVSDAIIKAWPVYKSLLGSQATPDKIIKITVMPGLDSNGVTSPLYTSGGMELNMEIQAGMDEKLTKSTTAHELFHCFQFNIPLEYVDPSTKWIMEASAVWAEHYIYEDYNKEFVRLPSFFYTLHEDMIRYDHDKEYDTYVWFLFLTQNTGSDVIVKDLLFAAKDKTGRGAIADLPELNDFFAEYALWNWNQDKWYLYYDNPSFPYDNLEGSPMKPSGKAMTTKIYQKDKKYNEKEVVDKLSAKYYLYHFDDEIKRIEFTFAANAYTQNRIQALVNIDDEWHYEDWSKLNEKIFCKTSPSQDVDSIVLILSNSNTQNSNEFEYKINTGDECPKAWRGTTKIEWSASKSTSYSGTLGKGSITEAVYKGEYISYDELKEDKGDFEIIKQYVSYNSEQYVKVKGIGGCGWQSQNDEKYYQGSFTIDASDERYKRDRWSFELDDDDKKTNKLYFTAEHFDPGFEWGTSEYIISSVWKSCDSSIPPTNKYQVSNGDLSGISIYGDSFDLIHDPKKETLKGTRVIDQSSGIYGDYDKIITYDYSYN